jgi:hypothetical protein
MVISTILSTSFSLETLLTNGSFEELYEDIASGEKSFQERLVFSFASVLALGC